METEREREERAPAPALYQRLNYLGLMAGFHRALRVEYNGQILHTIQIVILAIIQEENVKNGKLCKKEIIYSRIGNYSNIGKYTLELERILLLRRIPRLGYETTIKAEFLLREISTILGKILNTRPLRRRGKKHSGPHTAHSTSKRARNPWKEHAIGKYSKRPLAPIETFEALVKETINKQGLNKRVKYALLRTLGMKANEAKEAVKQLTPRKRNERIKPVLNSILTKLVSDTQPENLKG